MAKSECRVSSTKTMQAVGCRFDADCVKQHFNNSIILLVSQDRPVKKNKGPTIQIMIEVVAGHWQLIIVTGSHRIKS